MAWNDGSIVLHVTQRNGHWLVGIKIIETASDGQKTIITSDTGLVSARSSIGNTNDAVQIELQDVKIQSANTLVTNTDYGITLYEWIAA